MTPDIRDWRSIDNAWLTAALACGGIEAIVSSFEAEPVGTGQIGDCIRFSLKYESADVGAPGSLVGKFPSEGEASRSTGIALGNYYREVKFYQVLQERARISTPRCYYTDVDEETHDFVLMMSDLAPAEQGDQLAGVSIEQAEIALVEAAKLHAAYWNDDTLDDYHWVSGSKAAEGELDVGLVSMLWQGFLERYGERVTLAARHIGETMSANLGGFQNLREGPRTLVHADYRPDNMLFATPAGGAPLTVVDWQSFGYGPAASDVGYFVAGAIDVETRRREEERLLTLYLNELKDQGGGPYEAQDVHTHYVSGAFQHFLTAFFAAMMVTQTERGDDMFFRMLNGAVDLITDHKAQDWLA